jgi:asparagine synthase (glutamine-hydrolysing)
MDLVELLMKQDQMTMATSIESRVPFLDHLLVEFAGTIPPPSPCKDDPENFSLKRAAVPHNIVHRPKLGFPVPFGSWLKEESARTVRDIFLDKRTIDRGYFKVSYIEKLLKSHQSGQRDYQSQIY